jgi:hypothetical protein
MPGRTRAIDPLTHDYLDAGYGHFQYTTDASTALQHQMLGKKNHWVGDPDAGSMLYTVQKKSTLPNAIAVKNIVLTDLKPLVAAGLITDVTAEVARDIHGIFCAAEVRDVSGAVTNLSPLLPGGV